jgi:hypothetical protein
VKAPAAENQVVQNRLDANDAWMSLGPRQVVERSTLDTSRTPKKRKGDHPKAVSFLNLRCENWRAMMI